MHYPKVLERVDSPEQIFHRGFSLGAPEQTNQRWSFQLIELVEVQLGCRFVIRNKSKSLIGNL